MTLGDYYSYARRGLSPAQILNKVHSDAIESLNASVTEENCKKLEDFFNAAFYPDEKNTTNNYQQKISSLLGQAYQEKYNAVLRDFDIGAVSMSYGVSAGDIPQLARELYESFNHKEKIYVSTIKKRLDSVKKVLQEIQSKPNINAELQKQEMEMRSLEQQLLELLSLKTSSADSRGAFLDLKSDNNLFDQVQKMDQAFESLSQVGGVFSPHDYGQVLEWVLQAFSSKDNLDPIIDGVSNEIIEKGILQGVMDTMGSKLTGKSDIKMSKISIKEEEKVKKVKDTETPLTYFQIGTENSNFRFQAMEGFQPNSSRQGKMDVEFFFNDTQTKNLIPFKISAKNWVTTDRDFGQTQLAYALIRSLKLDTTKEYIYVMQDARSSSLVEGYHKVAKYAALLDILMGFSQKQQAADTIFLNIRSERRVKVFSISNLLNKINKDLDNFTVSGYDDGTIHNRIIAIRKALASGAGRSDQFENLSLKYLQATQVRIQYSAIAPYLGGDNF